MISSGSNTESETRGWTLYVCDECGHFSTEPDDYCLCLPDGLTAVPVVPAVVDAATLERAAGFWWSGVLDNDTFDAAKYPGPAGDEARALIAREVLKSAGLSVAHEPEQDGET